MEEIISYCGLTCHTCPAYLATKGDDDEQRAAVAKQWSKEFNADITPEAINCAGCLSDTGPHFSHCTVCKIRKCSRGKGVVNCAHCDDYSCETLEGLLSMVPESRQRLDAIREGL